MAVPLSYTWRNLVARKASAAVTVAGVALSVMVYAVISATAAGVNKIAVTTGERDNVIVLARGAASDDASRIPLETARTLKYLPQVARAESGKPLASVETKLARAIPRAGALPTDKSASRFVSIRGVTEEAFRVHRKIRLVEGRMPETPGEVLMGRLVPSKLGKLEMGDEIVFGRQPHKIVGIFEAAGQIFEGELWMGLDDLMSEFDLREPSVVVLRVSEPSTLGAFITELEESKRFAVEGKRESEYYKEVQVASTAFGFLGNLIGLIMGLGAIFAGMNTMYAAMSRRLRELGTMRALGFSKWEVGSGLLAESLLLGILGGALGLALALGFNGFSVNLFDLSFEIDVNAQTLIRAGALAAIIGAVGGFLPARAAARMPIVDALRTT